MTDSSPPRVEDYPAAAALGCRELLEQFVAKDAQRAISWLESNRDLVASSRVDDFAAHPILVCCVDANDGHCYHQAHRRIADQLLSDRVRAFRDAILCDDVAIIQSMLNECPDLANSKMTAGLGIGQPIHHWSKPHVAALLQAEGANLDATNTLGQTPLSIQRRFGTLDGMRWLLEQGANPNLGCRDVMPTESLKDRIELLLEFGWDINHGSLLHDANHGFGKRVELWLDFGADPNVQLEDGRNALHLLAKRGTASGAIKRLLDAGTSPRTKDQHGETPLSIARRAAKRTAENVIESWLSSHADDLS